MNIYTQIAKLQNEIGAITRDTKNPFFKSNYFDINSLLAELKPLLEKHELGIVQPLTNVDGKPAIKTEIFSTNDKVTPLSDWIVSDTIVLPESSDPQKMGSSITYYRRYALTSFLALQAQDDDGNRGGGKSTTVPTRTPAGASTSKICVDCRKSYTPYPGTELYSIKCTPCFRANGKKVVATIKPEVKPAVPVIDVDDIPFPNYEYEN